MSAVIDFCISSNFMSPYLLYEIHLKHTLKSICVSYIIIDKYYEVHNVIKYMQKHRVC